MSDKDNSPKKPTPPPRDWLIKEGANPPKQKAIKIRNER